MKYSVDFNYWQSGNGFSHSETFENGNSETTFSAKAYVIGFDDGFCETMNMADGEAIEVTVNFYADSADPMFDDPIFTDKCTVNSDGSFWED